MCTLDATPQNTNSTSIRRCFIYLPILAGCLHLHVFYRALSFLYLIHPSQPPMEIESSLILYFSMKLAVVLAYGFDLVCCAFSVVPYLGCKKASEIVAHHLPVFLILLPLGVPMWKLWTEWGPMFPFIESLDGEGRDYAISLLLRANGWGFLSSLNETIMCFQKPELPLHRLSTMFEPRDHLRPRFWTSWTMEFLELSYKMSIFWVYPILSAAATCETDWHYFYFNKEQYPSASIFMLLCKTYWSPVQLRSLVWRVFIVLFYPFMGKRTSNKLRRFLKEKKSK